MSQAKPPLPKPGTPNTLAVVNQVFTDIQTASGAVGGDNLAEEGLDEFSLTSQADIAEYFNALGPAVNANTAFAIMKVGVDVTTAGFTIGIDEIGVVRAEFQLCNDPAGAHPGIPTGRVVTARLRKSISSVEAVITGTTMLLSGTEPHTGCCVMDAVLTPGVYDWISVESKISAAGDYWPGFASIIVERFKRST